MGVFPEGPDADTGSSLVDFGKYAGLAYAQIPSSYLWWMVKVDHSRSQLAQVELNRRGATAPVVEISAHALDRASQRLLGLWQRDCRGRVGLHTWLTQQATAAWQNQVAGDKSGHYLHQGCVFVFSVTGLWPILKTVFRKEVKKAKNTEFCPDLSSMAGHEQELSLEGSIRGDSTSML